MRWGDKVMKMKYENEKKISPGRSVVCKTDDTFKKHTENSKIFSVLFTIYALVKTVRQSIHHVQPIGSLGTSKERIKSS